MAERMQVEGDDGAALLEALRQERVVGPQTREAAREASKVYELLLVAGVSRGDAAAKVSELFNPPRVAAELGRLSFMSLVGGSSFDLRRGANGVAWGFRKAFELVGHTILRPERAWCAPKSHIMRFKRAVAATFVLTVYFHKQVWSG